MHILPSLNSINLSIGYRNIEGLHNATFGCKHDYIGFYNDIEILAETWTNCNNCKNANIPNYNIIKKIPPKKKPGLKGRASGGLNIFCKTYLTPFIKVSKQNDSHIWLKINKGLFQDIDNDVLLCTIYSPPKNSKYFAEDIWEILKSEFLTLTTSNTPCILIGDVNARTGGLLDYHEPDNNDNLLLPPRNIQIPHRASCDKLNNPKGKHIIDICNSFDMQIANGRFRGDCWGNFTHHNKNSGQSTVDIAIVSDNLIPHIQDFKVLPQPDYSDHCQIILTIQNIKKQPTLADNDHAWYDTKPGLKWDLMKPFFQKALKTKEVLNEIDTCEQFLQAGLIDSSGNAIQNIFFLQAANASLTPHNTPIINKASHNNKRGNSNTKNKPKQKWFDKECHERKKMANALSIKKHDSPFNRQIAKEHKLALKL